MRTIAFVAGPALLALAAPSPASACGAPLAFLSRHVQPAPDATGVPVNAEIRVHYLGCTALVTQADVAPSLVTAGGEVVPATVEVGHDDKPMGRLTLLVRPDAPLAPFTTYEVRDQVQVTMGEEGFDFACGGHAESIALDAPVVIGTFTTGAGPDLEPPTFAGATAIGVTEKASGEDRGTCDPYYREMVRFVFEDAVDSATPDEIRYEVWAQGAAEPLARYLGSPVGVACSFEPDGRGPGSFVVSTPAPMLYLKAVDLAGNTAGPAVPLPVAVDCVPKAEVEPDPAPVAEAGPEAEADASTGDDTGTEADTAPEPATPDADGSGCAGGSASFGSLALALLTLLRRRP